MEIKRISMLLTGLLASATAPAAPVQAPTAQSTAGPAASPAAGRGGFSFEGFYPGLGKGEASRLHPEAQWLRDYREGPHGYNKLSPYYKEFRSSHLGKPVTVRIWLDDGGRVVDTVHIMFSAPSGKHCVSGADAARQHLNKTYGAGADSLDQVGNARVVWHAPEGYTVVWYSNCRLDNWYTISYKSHAG